MYSLMNCNSNQRQETGHYKHPRSPPDASESFLFIVTMIFTRKEVLLSPFICKETNTQRLRNVLKFFGSSVKPKLWSVFGSRAPANTPPASPPGA